MNYTNFQNRFNHQLKNVAKLSQLEPENIGLENTLHTKCQKVSIHIISTANIKNGTRINDKMVK